MRGTFAYRTEHRKGGGSKLDGLRERLAAAVRDQQQILEADAAETFETFGCPPARSITPALDDEGVSSDLA
jgi:hypothetical protein